MKSKHSFFTGFVFALAFTFFCCLRAYTAQFQLGTTNLLEPASFFAGFGEDTIEIAANPTNASWNITGNIPWLAGAPPSSGVGSSIVTFIFTNNPGATRTGTLTIASQTVTITQAGSNYVAAPEPATVVTTSELIEPYAVALDSAGNAYIADQAGAVFKWVKTNNTVITLVSGLDGPEGIAVDSQGNVYISNTFNNQIWEWTAANGHVTTLVSSGLSEPCGIAVDGTGNVYIADTGHNAIKEWVAASNNVVSLVSTGLNQPRGVAVDTIGNVYIGDTGNAMLKEWSPTNATVTVLTSYITTNGEFLPLNLAVDGSGNVYSASGQNIEKFSRGATLLNRLSVVASAGIEPNGVAVDNSGNIFIADTPNGALKELPHAFLVPATNSEPYIAAMIR